MHELYVCKVRLPVHNACANLVPTHVLKSNGVTFEKDESMEQFSLQLIATLNGHHDRVWSVAWSPKGDLLASCSADKTVRIWSPRRNPPPAFPTPTPTSSHHPHPQPQPKAPPAPQTTDERDSAALDGPLNQRQDSETAPTTATTATPSSCAPPGPLQHWHCCAILDACHTRTIRSVAWSPGGSSLATASFDATVAVWEMAGGVWEQVAELEGHENEVKCVDWNPDGRLIATCGRDRSVWIWESMPGREFECVDVKQGHTADVKVVRWHPGGEVLVSAGYDDAIKLWTYDGDEWSCSQTLGGSGPLPGHSSTVWDVAWEPGGRRLVSCSDDLTVKVWEPRRTVAKQQPVAAAAAAAGEMETSDGMGTSPAANRGDAQMGVFVPSNPDLRCGATLSGYHARTVFSVDWGAHGLIATGDGDDCIRVFGQGDPDLAHIALRSQPTAPPSAAAATDAPSSSRGDDLDATMRHEDGAVDRPTGKTEAEEEAEANGGMQVERTAGEGVGSAWGGGVVGEGGARLDQEGGPWGMWVRMGGAHDGDVNCVRWNPKHPRLLASCSDDGTVKLWWLQ